MSLNNQKNQRLKLFFSLSKLPRSAYLVLLGIILVILILNLIPSSSLTFYSNDINAYGEVLANGKVVFDKDTLENLPQKPKPKVILGLEADRIQIKFLDEPGVGFTSGKVDLDLSKIHAESIYGIKPKSYGIHGIGFTDEFRQKSHLIYQAYSINSEGIWTIEAVFPKGVLKPSVFQKILFWSANYSLPWFLTSIFLLIIMTSFIAYLLWKRYVLEKIKFCPKILTAPPSTLSSSAVAILEEKHATERAVAAGILYLASRGYLSIVKTDEGFLVAKHREPTELSGLDKKIYDLLIGNWFAHSVQGIRIENSRDLFNQAAGEIHRQLYQELSDRGFFVVDPWLSIHRTRIIGIILFYISTIGFFISLYILPYPPFASLLWIALIFASAMVKKISTRMPLRSQEGVKERQNWYKFKRFLSDSAPASELDLPMDIYLHYAVALRCEDKWISRFSRSNYRIPVWYVGPSVTMEDIASDIVEFIFQFSQIIDEGIPPEEK